MMRMMQSGEETIAETAEAPARGTGYRDITRALLADIRGGLWAIGDHLPTEAELVDRFGASRSTVRESLRELTEHGYIARRRGARSILNSRTPVNFVNSATSVEGLLQYSKQTLSRLLTAEIIRVGPALAASLRVEAGSEWLRIEMLRVSQQDGQPIGYSEIYVDPRYAAVADDLADGGIVYQMLEQHHGVYFERIDQEIEPVGATANVASRLAVPLDSATIQVRTEFVAPGDEVIEIGFGHFPAGRYKLKFGLSRGRGILSEEHAP